MRRFSMLFLSSGLPDGETPPFTDFVNEYNAFLKRYADVLAQRKGMNKAKKSHNSTDAQEQID
jgi:hypothetical protein